MMKNIYKDAFYKSRYVFYFIVFLIFVIMSSFIPISNLDKFPSARNIGNKKISGFWYSLNQGACFKNSDIFFWDKISISVVNDVRKRTYFSNIRFTVENGFVKLNAMSHVSFKKHTKAPYEITIIFRDKGSRLDAEEIRVGDKIYLPTDDEFFREFTMGQCSEPTIGGRIKSLFYELLEPK